jgi:hypothetical protein
MTNNSNRIAERHTDPFPVPNADAATSNDMMTAPHVPKTFWAISTATEEQTDTQWW